MTDKLSKKAAKKLEREKLRLQLKRDLLTREQALDETTLKKIKQKWYDTLLDMRIPEMQDNLRHILHFMEKIIETHNFRKLLFEEERQALDDMYVLQSQGQSSAIEALQDIFQKRLDDLNRTYSERVAERKKQADEEFDQIEADEGFIRENMQSMLFQMEQNRDKKEDQMNCDMFLKIDDEKSKNTERLDNLRTTLEKKMEKQWEDIGNTLATYDSSTKERRQHYMVLKAKDDYDSKIILEQTKKTQKLFEQLDELKNTLEYAYAPQEILTLIQDLKEERAKFFDAFNYLKKVMEDEVKEDQNQLKFLSMLTDGVIEEFSEICEKGKKILKLFRICRKLETEEEKILPVGDSLSLLKPVDGQEKRKPHQEERGTVQMDGASLTEHMTKDFEILNKFWKKAAKVRLSMMPLNKYIQNMKKENASLRRLITLYIKEMSEKKYSSFKK